MPYTGKVREFENKYQVNVNSQDIVNHVTTVLTRYKDNEDRDLKIKEYISQRYSDLASEHEIKAQQARAINPNSNNKSDAKEFFEGYLDIVSSIASATSNSLEKAAADAVIEAKQATENTAKAAAEAKTLAEEARRNNAWDYKDKQKAAEAAEEKAKNTAAREGDTFKFDRYEPAMKYFGLTSKEAEKMMLDQVNTCTYNDMRIFQMKKLGVTNPRFMQEMEAIGKVEDYSQATDDQKKALQEVHITKNLMQARLDRHWRIWKWFHPWQTEAMEKYVDEANKVLANAKFNGAEDAAKMADSGVDFNSDTVRNGVDEIKAATADNENKIQEKKAREEEAQRKINEEQERIKREKEAQEKEAQRLKEKQEKEAENKRIEYEKFKEKRNQDRLAKEKEIKQSIAENREQAQAEADSVTASTKNIDDKFFEIRFRPSLDKDVLTEQTMAMKRIAENYISSKSHVLPVGAKSVFNANYAKLKEARAIEKQLHSLTGEALQAKKNEYNDTCYVKEELAKFELKNLEVENYKPTTIEEIENATLQHRLKNDTTDKNAADKSTKPVEQSKVLDKEPINKSQG